MLSSTVAYSFFRVPDSKNVYASIQLELDKGKVQEFFKSNHLIFNASSIMQSYNGVML